MECLGEYHITVCCQQIAMSPPSKIGTEYLLQERLFTHSVLYVFTYQWHANHYLVLLSYRKENKFLRVMTGLKLQN